MALGALNLRMQAGQRISGLVVIELAHIDGFPVDEVVAGLAGRAQASLVKVFVAGNAGGRQTEKGAVQVLVLNGCPFLRRNSGRIVALITFDSGVLAFQDIPGLFVVKGLCIPLDQREICPVVLGVTAGALLAGAGREVIRRVQPPVSLKTAGDLGVAFQALKRRLAAKLVTSGAVRRSV